MSGVRLARVNAGLLLEQPVGHTEVTVRRPGVRRAAGHLAIAQMRGRSPAVPRCQLELLGCVVEETGRGLEILVCAQREPNSTQASGAPRRMRNVRWPTPGPIRLPPTPRSRASLRCSRRGARPRPSRRTVATYARWVIGGVPRRPRPPTTT